MAPPMDRRSLASGKFVFETFWFDVKTERLYRDQEVIRVSAKALAVLRNLLLHAGSVVTKDQLLDAVWPDANVGEAVLTVAIRELRLALGDSTRAPRLIETAHRQGYQFIAPVEWLPHTSSAAPDPTSEHGAAAPAGRTPRYRSPYINVSDHLGHLQSYVQAAITGQPRVVLLEGEAGIGKTRLLREGQTLAIQAAAAVCYGRCSEDLSLPYLPFVESLLAHLEQAHALLPPEIDVDIEAIRWLSRPHEIEGVMAPSFSAAQIDQYRLRLFLAVSRTTLALAQHHPICFFLDDLHWADPASLDLFEHLVLAMADAATQHPLPLLIIATFRPAERGSRLARFVSRFQSEVICQPIALQGFDEVSVMRYIQGLNLGRPSNQLIATIHAASGGNPLFMQEILQYLINQQALEVRQGDLITRVTPENLKLPEHMTGALMNRLNGLSPKARRTLTLASLLGNRFSLSRLSAVSDMDEDELLDVLEEAMEQGLLWNEGQDFEFDHPLVRHVLSSMPSEARRQRSHHRIAQTLERLYANALHAYSMEIAHHLLGAGEMAEPEAILTYARQAGAQALASFAWTDAIRYFEAALAAAKHQGDIAAADAADLHYRAGFAYQRAADAGPSVAHYDRAIEAYREAGDVQGWAQAQLDKSRTQLTLTSVSYGTLLDVEPLHDALEALGERDLRLRGHIASIMADIYSRAHQIEQAEEMVQRALDIGQHLEDDALCSRASSVRALLHVQGHQRVKEALQSWRVALDYARRAQDMWLQANPPSRMSLMLTMLGQLDEAEAVAREARQISRTLQSWGNGSLVLASLTAIHTIRGQFDLAEQYANESLVMATRSGFTTGCSRAYFTLAGAFSQLGARDRAMDALAMQVEPGRLFAEPSPSFRLTVKIFEQLLLAYLGQPLEESLTALVDQLANTGSPGAYPPSIACAMAELGSFAGAADIAAWGEPQLIKANQQEVVFTSGWVFLVPRILGVIATLKTEWETAESHFQTALAVANRVDAQPELARTYLDYARMVVAKASSGQVEQASEWVGRAQPIFDRFGMEPFAQRTKKLAETGGF